MQQPALKNSRFVCFPVSGQSVLTSGPQNTIERLVGLKQDIGVSLSRRLNQPLGGVSSSNFSGMLTNLDNDAAADFLSERRSGVVEKSMSEQLAVEFGAGPKNTPVVAPSASPLQRARQKLGKLIPRK